MVKAIGHLVWQDFKLFSLYRRTVVMKLPGMLIACGALFFSGCDASASSLIYTNGVTTGAIDGWSINLDFRTTDSFTLSSTSTISGFEFGGWTSTAGIAETVDYGFSSTVDFSITGTASLIAGPIIIQYTKYDIRNYTSSITPVTLGAGTYWFTLQNATATDGNRVYWDESDGSSLAYQDNPVNGYSAAAPSQAFALAGDITAVPEPATWAMMLLGFSFLGYALRSGRQKNILVTYA